MGPLILLAVTAETQDRSVPEDSACFECGGAAINQAGLKQRVLALSSAYAVLAACCLLLAVGAAAHPDRAGRQVWPPLAWAAMTAVVLFLLAREELMWWANNRDRLRFTGLDGLRAVFLIPAYLSLLVTVAGLTATTWDGRPTRTPGLAPLALFMMLGSLIVANILIPAAGPWEDILTVVYIMAWVLVWPVWTWALNLAYGQAARLPEEAAGGI